MSSSSPSSAGLRPPRSRPTRSTDALEPPLRHVVALERRLSDAELERVVRTAAPQLGVPAERLRRFLDRRGVAPLTASLDAWSSVTLADTLRGAGAPVRLWTTPRSGPSAVGETWSGVRVGRPTTLADATPRSDPRARSTTVVRAEPRRARPFRVAFWTIFGATWLGLVAANVALLR